MQPTSIDYSLVGYFPKLRATRSTWHTVLKHPENHYFPAPAGIDSICSASNCICRGPSCFDFPEISHRTFNQYGGFNSFADALKVIPDESRSNYDIYGYSIPEIVFEDGIQISNPVGECDPETQPEVIQRLVRLGFDVIEIDCANIGHSPLTCNGQAGIYKELLNQYCLVEKESDALMLAEKFSIDKPEPGNYTPIEIWLYDHSMISIND